MVNRQFYVPATPAAAVAAVECSGLIGLHYAVAVLPGLEASGKREDTFPVLVFCCPCTSKWW